MKGNTLLRLTLLGSLIAAAAILAFILATPQATADEGGSLVYEIRAENAQLNRQIFGEVTANVQGVPAEPVHSFVWDGDGAVAIEGAEVEVEIDPASNTGFIKAAWSDRNGYWTFEQTAFAPPPHSTGLQVTSAGSTRLIQDDPVTTDVYLHGDTTAGGPVLPTLFNNLATWGPAEVTLNGEPFDNPYDGPTPLWVAHTMTTPGVRNVDDTVRVDDGRIYNPTLRGQPGNIDYDDMEFHLVFHDAPGPGMTGNFPPPLSFFYHLTFEDVKMEVKHSE